MSVNKGKTVMVRILICLIIYFVGVPAMADPNPKTAYDFSFKSISGKPLPLSQFRGKVVLLVNTASQCGFTGQYNNLQSVWSRFREHGLVVLGVPSNDFGNQEPRAEVEIKRFCEVNFNVDFPLTNKVHVTGSLAHPFYQWAASELGFLAMPRWNFHKYLIGPYGNLVDWFSTPTSPTSKKIIKAIEAQLALSAKSSQNY